ncbi:pathogenesis-related thaumatin-like protein 3.5 isoform X2 [Coffea arabica]
MLAESTNLTIINGCNETIWPGITPNDNSAPDTNISGGGFQLKPDQSVVFSAPPGWNGRIWGRTGCDFDKEGSGKCETGDCGSTLKCKTPGQPPASIAQFAFGNLDYYDVSLVDGFNLPITVKPISGKGNCSTAGCDSDLRPHCPPELAVNSSGKSIACNSACNVFNTDEYCCRGAFSTPLTCMPTNYSRTFKTACPAAYSYAYDDPSSIITCSATDYVVTFCSSRNQTRCTYHDRTLTCNEAKGPTTFSPVGKMLLLALPAVLNLGSMF